MNKSGDARVNAASATSGVIETTVSGLGFELVDVELVNGGRFLRIFIDRPSAPAGDPLAGISLADCELVTRQLQHVLTVEGIDYDRLEVSSPGLDRVLKKPADFRRFVGFRAELRLRVPLNGRKRFTGELRGASDTDVDVDIDGTPMSFAFIELERARLVPQL